MMFSTGYRRDPTRPAMKSFSAHRFAALPYAAADDLTPFAPAIYNQGQTGSCFPGDTPVLMGDFTERPIEEIGIGNVVITHDGKRRSVTNRFVRDYSGNLYTIRLKGYGYPLTMTAEHPIGVVRTNEKLEWIKASDLRPDDFVLMPGRTTTEELVCAQLISVDSYLANETIQTGDGRTRLLGARNSHTIPQTIAFDETFARLIGLFLAEGSFGCSSSTVSSITFTFARHETEYHQFVQLALRDIFGVESKKIETEIRPSVTDIGVDNATLARFFESLCGRGALYKRVPTLAFSASRSVRMSLIRGWLEGDGSQERVRIKSVGNGKLRKAAQCDGVTSSREMHRDLFRLSLMSGLKPGATTRNQESHQNAPANNLVFYSNDIVEIFPEAADSMKEIGLNPTGRTRYRRHALGFLCRIDSIEISLPEEPIKVFNLEIDETHTYIANHIAVHNCVGHARSRGLYTSAKAVGNAIPFIPSPADIYALARCFEYSGELQDNGCDPYHSILAVSKFGMRAMGPMAPDGRYSDADPATINVKPDLLSLESDYPNMSDGDYQIASTGNQRVQEVLSALNHNMCVCIDVPGGSNEWQNYGGGSVLTSTGDPNDHYVCLVGYDTNAGWFKGHNSWDVNWGELGMFKVDDSVIAAATDLIVNVYHLEHP